MFVGHGLFAFALVGALASRRYPRRVALALAALAAGFATVPDVDIAYAPVGVVTAGTAAPLELAASFWATGNEVHRAVTHSLVVAPVVALLATAWLVWRRGGDAGGSTGSGSTVVAAPAHAARAALRSVTRRHPTARDRPTARRRLAALVLAVGLACVTVATATAASGLLGGLVTLLFCFAAVAVAEAAVRTADVSPAGLFAVAFVGLASHPFGDLLTGEPPALLYPFDVTMVAARVTLHPDPTLHLLGAFGVELAAIWAGVAVYLRLVGHRPRLAPRVSLAGGYAASVLVIPAPTLDLSYPFVFSVLAVGLVGVPFRLRSPLSAPDTNRPGVRSDTGPPLRVERMDGHSALVTALSGVTVAWVAYGVGYLLVG